ncbi:hypothetical protein PoB_002912000 [Plakobranchus ocellatus]|uniref:Uncharacterized protein n=1 Tax=Plakobranchus ocellatus TaxID=259542 RepID=A0AAV4A5F8_9GAST|nr:hypothetical protein PoB_002912000 [Plakobranchus ocellatus]
MVILRFQTRPGAGGRARSRDRRVPADLGADTLATVPLTSQWNGECVASLSDVSSTHHPSLVSCPCYQYPARRHA